MAGKYGATGTEGSITLTLDMATAKDILNAITVAMSGGGGGVSGKVTISGGGGKTSKSEEKGGPKPKPY